MEVRGELLEAERHLELAPLEPQRGEKLEIDIGIPQSQGVREIRYNFEVEPLKKVSLHRETGAPDEELAAKPRSCEGPCVLLGLIEIELESTAHIEPDIAIGRPNEEAPALDAGLQRRGLFLLGFFL